MNKRILELAKQSGLIQYDSDGKLQDAEKFAELIVEEFVNLAKNKSESIVSKAELYDLYATDESELDKAKATAWQFLVFGQEIKKHFGVE